MLTAACYLYVMQYNSSSDLLYFLWIIKHDETIIVFCERGNLFMNIKSLASQSSVVITDRQLDLAILTSISQRVVYLLRLDRWFSIHLSYLNSVIYSANKTCTSSMRNCLRLIYSGFYCVLNKWYCVHCCCASDRLPIFCIASVMFMSSRAR